MIAPAAAMIVRPAQRRRHIDISGQFGLSLGALYLSRSLSLSLPVSPCISVALI